MILFCNLIAIGLSAATFIFESFDMILNQDFFEILFRVYEDPFVKGFSCEDSLPLPLLLLLVIDY